MKDTFEIPGFIHAVDPTLFTRGPDVLSSDLDESGTIAGVQTPIPQRVIDLLNKPINLGDFSRIRP